MADPLIDPLRMVAFVGGPLDGARLPTSVSPDLLLVTTTDGTVHLYECDREDETEDGRRRYRLVPPTDPEGWWEDLDDVLDRLAEARRESQRRKR